MKKSKHARLAIIIGGDFDESDKQLFNGKPIMPLPKNILQLHSIKQLESMLSPKGKRIIAEFPPKAKKP
ncbi:MAG TPA: hypothetical protein HA227_01290 [Candidatus Diapherotrites archaeon]|uniref:Uncharacterized protein n=1 Tax=Candidatus Iainarchaeum sp. TaxID=3101447 RepID=A0A7J4KT44_9ARCH|nr:hypothetical protein [Candidatus Diapherotrites archaeon]